MEYVYDKDTGDGIWSASKMTASMLVGRIVDDGKLDYDAPMHTYFVSMPHNTYSLDSSSQLVDTCCDRIIGPVRRLIREAALLSSTSFRRCCYVRQLLMG